MVFRPVVSKGEKPDISTWIALSTGATGGVVEQPRSRASRRTAVPASPENVLHHSNFLPDRVSR